MPPITLFRYIAVRTLASVMALYVILASLILLIDLIENLRFSGKVASGGFSLAMSLTALRVPALSQALTPFVFLFGAIWTFNQLNRRSEVAVMRSAGLSVWRVIGPSAFVAVASGVLIITAFDPISSNLLSISENLKAEKEGKNQNVIQVFGDGIWLRQKDGDSNLIINARSYEGASATLSNVTVMRFSSENAFLERIDARNAVLSGATIELHDARLRSIDDREVNRAPVYALPTTLTPEDLRERVAPPETMSLWRLPKFIGLADAAGLPTTRYHLRFHDLCSTPLKLLAMVFIAAAFSLRPMRLGGALPLFVASIIAGFALYILSEISNALGESGLAPVALAAWTPAVIATIGAVTALLHIEDG